jgi:peptide methionine sulfoxide reductase msrA/msrB
MNANLLHTITFAGGCFWGVEAYFARMPGVISTEVGYANGNTDKTHYETIEDDGFAEAVRIDYDPQTISLKTLTHRFFDIINPLSKNRQGADIGTQYRTGVYYDDPQDLDALSSVFTEIEAKLKANVEVELEKLRIFLTAEKYHQKYLQKNPNGYCHINPQIINQKW